jgi:hypothetical protein
MHKFANVSIINKNPFKILNFHKNCGEYTNQGKTAYTVFNRKLFKEKWMNIR